ncbi:MAG: hypothetical protein C4522_22190 [Desulfobacteraceae bacterium]|nr:MAG: hypothetical protein C4522_22190 [Desulfobacteraceae bacterium]
MTAISLSEKKNLRTALPPAGFLPVISTLTMAFLKRFPIAITRKKVNPSILITIVDKAPGSRSFTR